MQDNSDLARFLARNKNLASFLASVACKIFTIFLQDMQENGHFAWTSCKISKKYRKVRPRLWDLACMILARIVDELARWFDLGYQTSIEDNWQLLKHAIDNAIIKYIPSKLARSHDKLPRPSNAK